VLRADLIDLSLPEAPPNPRRIDSAKPPAAKVSQRPGARSW